VFDQFSEIIKELQVALFA